MPRWRVDIIRKRAEHLGTVEAATEKEAIEKAAERFEIPPERRNRIALFPCDPIDGRNANRRAVESSPIATIDQWHSPVLLVQADNDGVVPSQQAAELIEGLRSHNIDHDVIMIPNEIHDIARYSSWMMLFNAADVYFDRHLDKRSAPSR